jgi:hypothetical protein
MLSSNLVSLWSRVNTKKATVEPKISSTRMDFTTERLSFNPDAGRHFLSLENTNRTGKLATRILGKQSGSTRNQQLKGTRRQ